MSNLQRVKLRRLAVLSNQTDGEIAKQAMIAGIRVLEGKEHRRFNKKRLGAYWSAFARREGSVWK